MTPERYRRINELADAVLELPEERRAGYLMEYCPADDEMRLEVQRLVEAQISDDEFLGVPAVARLAHEFAGTGQNLSGQRIGRYEMVSRLGAGGHGEVWLAEDCQLSRRVAVKLLSPEFASHPDHVSRLHREARLSSALNHPNIVTIYDTGQWTSTSFIAQEYVDGETLRQLLAKGPLDLRRALNIATQIACALEASHAAGVVHRDIKPENVMIRADGLVKVVDFGLARTRKDAQSESGSPGVVMGTAKYMAPEQMRGEPVDTRSDIFSFGVLLYETVVGQPPFNGATYVEILDAVLHTEAGPPSRRVRTLPAMFDRVVGRCLAKDPAGRYPTATALLQDLRSLARRTDPDASTRRRWLVGMAAAASAAGGFAIYRALAPGRPAPFDSMSITRLTMPGITPDAAISPDGSSIAYVLQESRGQSVWLRRLSPSADRPLLQAVPGSYRNLTFSPDGRYVYYVQGPASWTGSLLRIPLAGGAPETILENVTVRFAFSPDGSQVAFIRLDSERWEEALIVARIDADSGRAVERRIATRRRPLYFSRNGLAWSPDGRSIACLAGDEPFYTVRAFHLIEVDVASGAEHPLGRATWAWAGSLMWSSDGGSLFVGASQHSGESLQVWRVAYPTGAVQRITNDLSNYRRLTQASTSNMLLAVRQERMATLWVMPGVDSSRAIQVSSDEVHGLNDAVLGPGDQIFFSALSGNARNLWSMDRQGSRRRQLTTGDSDQMEVTVSLDGTVIVFTSEGRIWRMNGDGSAPRQLTSGPLDVHPTISPDGKWVVYASFSGWSPGIGGRSMLWRVPVEGGEADQITTHTTSIPAISPDGRLIACDSFDDTQPDRAPGIAVYSFGGGPALKTFDRPPGAEDNVSWSAEGGALDYIVTTEGVGNIWRQSLKGGPPSPVTTFTSGRLFFTSLSPDRKTMLLGRGKEVNDLVLITGIRSTVL